MANVVGDVEHVLPEPDHRGLMADRVDAAQRSCHDAVIGHVAVEHLSVGVQIVGPPAVRRGQHAVHHAHVMPACDQRVDDVRPDEAGSARDEDHAAPRYGIGGARGAPRRSEFRSP